MCYAGCSNERSDGMCRLRYPKCDQGDDYDNAADELADKLWDELQDGETTESQVRSKYQRLMR